MIKHLMKGMGDVLCLWPPSRSYVMGGPEQDARALSNDWKAIGNDLRASLANVEQEHNGNRKAQRPRSTGFASFYR